jgi:hypothetical protein
MMRKLLFILVLFLCFGCKAPLINQKVDRKKEGKWVDVYVQDSIQYKSFEYYKHDQPVK